MREHASIRLLLYDYAMDELQSEDRSRVEQHVRSCPTCAEHLESLRETCRAFERREVRPSTLRGDGYWESFAASVA